MALLLGCSKPAVIEVAPVHKRTNVVGCLVIAKATNRGDRFAAQIKITAMATDRSNDNLGYASDRQDIAGLESREFEFSFGDVDCNDIAGIGFSSNDAAVLPRNGIVPSFEIDF